MMAQLIGFSHAAASQPTSNPAAEHQLFRWRQTFFWAAVLVLIFFISVWVVIRFTLRYRAYLFREKTPPTPSDDVWKMHRLPEDEEPIEPDEEGEV